MSVEIWLKILIACLSAVGSLTLALAERNQTLVILSIMVPTLSLCLVDLKGWFHLNSAAANVGAFLALVVAARDLDQVDPDKALLAMAHLLIYLQFVLLFKRKTVRHCWILALASVLEVAVASALGVGPSFGLFLLLYTSLFLATLTVLGLHHERVRHLDREAVDTAATVTLAEILSRFRFRRRRSAARVERTIFVGQALGEVAESALNLRLVGQIVALSLTSVLCTTLVFAFVPRFGRDQLEQTTNISGPLNVVGFSQEVTLGEIGTTIESPEAVFRVRFLNRATGQPITLAAEPLIRGTVLSQYSGNGKWTQPDQQGNAGDLRSRELPATLEVVRQEFTIEPLDTNVLFSIYPFIKVRDNDRVQYDRYRETLVRPSRARNSQLAYELDTIGVDRGRMRRLVPAVRQDFFQDQIHMLTALAGSGRGDPFSAITAVAQQVVQGIAPQDHQARAEALERHLARSGEFAYTLTPVARDQTLDPIEDFVSKHREGHCEYFASALVMMLRSVGIPARIVYGFKGGDYNTFGGFYQFRQLHAHTWVEAYIAGVTAVAGAERTFPDQVGAWLVLDPTAAKASTEMTALHNQFGTWRQVSDYLRYVWSAYIVGLDAQRQEDAIYRPIRELFAELIDRQWWRERAELWSAWFLNLAAAIARGEWFSWRGGLAAMFVMTLALGLFAVTRKLFARIMRKRKAVKAARHREAGVEVEFYRRYEQLVAKRGRRRRPEQTHREFAQDVAKLLTTHTAARDVATLPRLLADMFYRVRYGHRPLDNQESQALEQAIARFDEALRAASNGRESAAR